MRIPLPASHRFFLQMAALFAVFAIAVSPRAAAEAPLGTVITYQGGLSDGGVPVDEPLDGCGFRFTLWDADMDGSPVGPTLTPNALVTDGGFTVALDFGSNIFTGEARFLEIAVCCPAPCGDFTTLSPRQELTPAPYSLHTPSAESVPWSGLTDVPAGFADDVDDDALGALSCVNGEIPKWDGAAWQCGADIDTDTMYDGTDFALSDQSCTPGDVVTGVDAAGAVVCAPDTDTDTLGTLFCGEGEIAKWNSGAAQWECAADDAGAGGASTLDEAYDGGGAGAGRSITADAGAVEILGSGGLTVAGTIQSGNSIIIDGVADTITSNGDLELHVNDGRALRLETNTTSPNVIGGYGGNSVASDSFGSTIAGGGSAVDPNSVFDHHATVGGGRNNQAGSNDANPITSQAATVGGGEDNTASGGRSVVGGGLNNTASASTSTVAGGNFNTASGSISSVGGGNSNTASASAATVGGGNNNTASGFWSTVGGGSDNTAGAFMSTVPGGVFNEAVGSFSFAAGRRAKANHNGTFVWGDSTDADVASTALNQFLIRAAGGVGIGTDSPSEQLDVVGNIHSSGTITSGSSIIIDGTAETITSNGDLELHVNHGRALRIETISNVIAPNIIGGYAGNTVEPGAVGVIIAGGGRGSELNRVHHQYATVSGGLGNRAGNVADPLNGMAATVGGGRTNTASGSTATVGGGEGNTASGFRSTVAGGNNNLASGDGSAIAGGASNEGSGSHSTVGGGSSNTASGFHATVPGGKSNTADGENSFAAGFGAMANHEGVFAWGDSTGPGPASSAANQFLIRAAGGVGIGTSAPTEQLDVLGNIHASGTISGSTISGDTISGDAINGGTISGDTITSGGSIVIDGATDTITSNGDLELHVNDGRALRLETNADSPNLIGGYSGNSVTSGAKGATIGGGGGNFVQNRVFDDHGTIGGGSGNRAGSDDPDPLTHRFATVGGGIGNTASGNISTVAGGNSNTASGQSSSVGGGQVNIASGSNSTVGGGDGNDALAAKSTVGGGTSNTASGLQSTVGGGSFNTAGGSESTVGGGTSNTASGFRSTVPGGVSNTAGGPYSFGAGRQAKANNSGAFVWADAIGVDFPSATEAISGTFNPSANQFLARTTGGAVFVSAVNGATGDSTAGVQLAAGGGSWSSLSDRNAKENVRPVDGREVLDKLAGVPVATWNYKAQDESIRHIGPMAQDFAAAFGVGEKETMITTLDADGVALAAIQGLHEIAKEKDAAIDALRAKNTELEARLERLEALIGAAGGERSEDAR